MLRITEKFWSKKYLNLYKRLGKNKHSEHGEDSVIEAVFGKKKGYFVDVGAWGDISSNTLALIERGWRGLWIDKNPLTFHEIDNHITFYKGFVIFDQLEISKTNLSGILDKFKVPRNLDFLSIDIDSYEYEVWENLDKKYKPKLVCIEVNGMEDSFDVENYDPEYTKGKGGYGGATIGLMNKLANKKGYDYLCWDVSNVFYIRQDYVKKM